MILDEADAHLDGEGVVALARAVSDFKAEGGAAVIVAHGPDLFGQCDDVLTMKDGRVHKVELAREAARGDRPGRAVRVVPNTAPAQLRRASPAKDAGSGAGASVPMRGTVPLALGGWHV